jgi:hypothetical protein
LQNQIPDLAKARGSGSLEIRTQVTGVERLASMTTSQQTVTNVTATERSTAGLYNGKHLVICIPH